MTTSNDRSAVRVLLADPDFDQYFHYGSGVQRSDIARLAYQLLGARRRARSDRPRRPTETLPTAERERVAAWLDEARADLLLIADTTAAVVGAIRAMTPPPAVTLEDVSGRACSAATAHVREHGGPVRRPEVEILAARIVDTVTSRPPRPTAEEFAGAWGPTYDALWDRTGAINLRAFPPSSLLLGADERPPLVPASGVRESDDLGTDRSVYGRLRGYRPVAPGARIPFRSRAARCLHSTTLKQPDRDVAAEEVPRACEPYGLNRPGHRVALRGVYLGLSADQSRPTDGNDLRLRCLSLHGCSDEAVARAVRSLVDERLRRHERNRERDRAGGGAASSRGAAFVDQTSWQVEFPGRVVADRDLERVSEVVLRRVWKALHGLEMYVEEDACSCSLTAVVAVALDRAVPAALTSGRRPRRAASAESTTEAPTAAQITSTSAATSDELTEALDELARQNTTVALLMEHREPARGILLREPGWEAAYDDLVAACPERYLSHAELAAWSAEHVPTERRGAA